MAQPSAKKQRTHPPYELLYHPGIPGRGEYIRLVLEAAGVAYKDIARDEKDGYSTVQDICMNTKSLSSSDGNPPVFAPPALRVPGAGKDGKALVISQTPNIIAYLGERVGMAGDGEEEKWQVNQVALTALDLSNEVHDSHHPIAVSMYYEDQREEAKARAKDLRESRLPKFFSYFQRTLQHNSGGGGGGGKFLVGGQLTYADTTVWQVLDGCMFAFPKEMEAKKTEFPELLGGFYEGVREQRGVKEYLASERRQEYSMGLFRRYPELDRQ